MSKASKILHMFGQSQGIQSQLVNIKRTDRGAPHKVKHNMRRINPTFLALLEHSSYLAHTLVGSQRSAVEEELHLLYG